jgi:hypothetical protein
MNDGEEPTVDSISMLVDPIHPTRQMIVGRSSCTSTTEEGRRTRESGLT